MSVADPEFPRGGLLSYPPGGANMILPNFPQNCMKLKEFGLGEAVRIPYAPIDPPMQVKHLSTCRAWLI